MFELGIVGLGPWARRLVDAVQGRSETVRVRAAATRSPAKAADFCKDRGISLGSDIDAVLNDASVDGLVIAGPAFLHAEQAMRALDAGKHVLVIKPLALKKTEAEAAYARAAEKGLTLAVGYDRCFAPVADALRQRVRAGDLGRIVHAEADFCVDRYFGMTPDDWKSRLGNAPPGSLADHMLYTMIELIGPVAEVEAAGGHLATDLEVCDTSSVRLGFAGGVRGALTAIGVTPNFHRLHLFGTEGWMEARGNIHVTFQPRKGEAETVELAAVDALRRMQEAFAAAASGGTPYPVTPGQGIAGVAALEAMGRSFREGRAVAV